MSLSENGIKLLDIVVKGLLGTAIAGGIAYYGQSLQNERAKVQEETRQFQAATELTTRQKDFDLDLGMRLFGTLMTYYFDKETPVGGLESAQRRLLLLRLVALNFQDVPIQLKPLFEDLDRRLVDETQKQALRAIAQEVAGRQAYRMTAGGGYDSGTLKVRQGEKMPIPELLIAVEIVDVSPAGVTAKISSPIIGNRSIGPFTVSPFDTPLSDNTTLGEYRVSLLLRDYRPTEKAADVRFVAFPKHLAADRFDIKDLARQFRDLKR